MAYYSPSASNLSSLSLILLARKLEIFNRTHKDRLKFEAMIAGAKLK
ncbi:tape assembly chaperone [Agrobacterium phage OLIVR4]|nr:tape assembly chaperone [Agrobacterium phage OLIVR4]